MGCSSLDWHDSTLPSPLFRPHCFFPISVPGFEVSIFLAHDTDHDTLTVPRSSSLFSESFSLSPRSSRRRFFSAFFTCPTSRTAICCHSVSLDCSSFFADLIRCHTLTSSPLCTDLAFRTQLGRTLSEMCVVSVFPPLFTVPEIQGLPSPVHPIVSNHTPNPLATPPKDFQIRPLLLVPLEFPQKRPD